MLYVLRQIWQNFYLSFRGRWILHNLCSFAKTIMQILWCRSLWRQKEYFASLCKLFFCNSSLFHSLLGSLRSPFAVLIAELLWLVYSPAITQTYKTPICMFIDGEIQTCPEYSWIFRIRTVIMQLSCTQF